MTREADEGEDRTAGSSEREPFLSRWSRRKQEAREEPPAQAKQPDADGPAPVLPPIDKLTFDSEYRDFFHPKVGEDVRRAALKKLFGDPRFNVMDGLDVYIDDYSKTEPIPAAMLASLRQAQNILQWAREDEEQRARQAQEQREATGADTPAVAAPEPGTQAVAADAPAVPASKHSES